MIDRNDISWKFRFGEFEIIHNNYAYLLEIGYMKSAPDDLYLRLWDKKEDKFLAGTWYKNLDIHRFAFVNSVPISIIECYVKRLEKLKVFA